ncbi:MAG: DUF1501 domain-containing protein [Verrucomicrobiales bacterium]
MNWTRLGLPHYETLHSRRDFLLRAGAGFGALALAGIMNRSQATTTAALPPGRAQYRARARSVIFLFMEGGPSHLDTFDPKPLLNKLAGQRLPESFGSVLTAMGEEDSPLLACQRQWKQHGQSGLWVSDWLPHIAGCADDLCVIRSCVCDGVNHSAGVAQMNSGSIIGGRPSLGSWVSYGLGTENNDLPSYVVLTDSNDQPVNGARNWSSGFMPAAFQGVQLRSEGDPIPNLSNPLGVSASRHQAKLALLEKMNRRFAQFRPEQSELEARIKSYELAFRMQATAPAAVDIAHETAAIREMYGLEENETAAFGRNCLLARRLVERGVRFVQLYSGSGSKWDSHSKIEENHGRLCRQIDRPIAALLKDLKQRGLLDETLVIWGGEFGRTPMSEKGDGRDHNPTGFTMWMAGGGVKPGQAIGSTDDLGLRAVEDRLHVHDLHATIMHLLGIDHTRLLYFHQGRPERVDLNEGEAYTRITGAA